MSYISAVASICASTQSRGYKMHMNDRYKKNPLTYAMPGYDIGVGHAVCMPCHAVPCNLSRIAWYTLCSGPLGRGTTELAIAIFIFDT